MNKKKKKNRHTTELGECDVSLVALALVLLLVGLLLRRDRLQFVARHGVG
jgi:hypothetical protein